MINDEFMIESPEDYGLDAPVPTCAPFAPTCATTASTTPPKTNLDAMLEIMASSGNPPNPDSPYGADPNDPNAPLPHRVRAIKDYPQNFVMELALGLDSADTLCIRYDYTPHEFAQLQDNPTFKKDLLDWKQRMADEGLSFKFKARVQAEAYLHDIDQIIADPTTSKETKLAAISRVVEWGGLSAKTNGSDATASGKSSITINIARFSDPEPTTIEICP